MLQVEECFNEKASSAARRVEHDVGKPNFHEAYTGSDDSLRSKILTLTLFEGLAAQHLEREGDGRNAEID